jgi:diguanylate cyclase (GGDEF)-like protein
MVRDLDSLAEVPPTNARAARGTRVAALFVRTDRLGGGEFLLREEPGGGGMADRKRTALVVMPRGPERELVLGSLKGMELHVSFAEEPYGAIVQIMEEPADLLVLSLEKLTLSDCPFLRELRRLSPSLRVVVLVPEGRRRDAVAFLEAGADALLPQTFLPDEFRLIVRSLLRSEAADPLTGLPNRAAYDFVFPREIARADRENKTLALSLFDVDKFKRLNTELGYKRADEFLVEVASRLQRMCRYRSGDLVARWGGDEFPVLLTSLPEDEGASRIQTRSVLNRAREAVCDNLTWISGDAEVPVTVSGGFALFPHDVPRFKRPAGEYLSADECEKAGRALFDLAELALQEVKSRGGNCIVGADELVDL